MEDREARSLVGRQQLLSFVALTFAISWAIWSGMALMSMSIGTSGGAILNVIALSGPIAALILSAVLARGSAYGASLLLGLIWGLWHIPLFFVPGTGQFETVSGGTSPASAIGAFVVWTIGLSILFTWLFNETRGSLIVVILFHTSINLGAFVPAAVGSTGAASFLYAIVAWIVALVVVSRFGRASLARSPAVTVADIRGREVTAHSP